MAGPLLDTIVQKIVSRKLVVWIVGCVFLIVGLIDPTIWLYLSMTYLGVQLAQDTASSILMRKSVSGGKPLKNSVGGATTIATPNEAAPAKKQDSPLEDEA